jgi:hypothetical protein
MNWLIIVFSAIPLLIIAVVVLANVQRKASLIAGACVFAMCWGVLFGIGLPLGICKQNIHDKYDWYMETRLKYAEAEGIEKMYLEMTDVMTYNLWYAENKEDLENPWNFKSAAGCEFDYIRIKGE